MTLDEARAHIGDPVVYTAPHGALEDGVITRVGTTYVFVRYKGDGSAKATAPEDLRLRWLPMRRRGRWHG